MAATPSNGNSQGQETWSLGVSSEDIQRVLKFTIELEKHFLDLLGQADKFGTTMGTAAKNVEANMKAIEKFQALQEKKGGAGTKYNKFGDLTGAENQAKQANAVGATINSIIKAQEAQERNEQRLIKLEESRLATLNGIKEIQKAITLEEEKRLLNKGLGNTKDMEHAATMKAQLEQRLKTEQEILKVKELGSRAQQNKQTIANERVDALFGSNNMMFGQRNKIDVERRKLIEDAALRERALISARQNQTVEGIQKINGQEALTIERMAAILRLQDARIRRSELEAEAEYRILQAIKEQQKLLANPPKPLTDFQRLEQQGKLRQQTLALANPQGYLDLRSSTLQGQLDSQKRKALLEEQSAIRLTADGVKALQKVEDARWQTKLANHRLQKAMTAQDVEAVKRELELLDLLSKRVREINKPAPVPLTGFQLLRQQADLRMQGLATANPNSYLDLRSNSLQRQFDAKNRTELLNEQAAMRISLEQVKTLTRAEQIRWEKKLAGHRLNQAMADKDIAAIRQELEMVEALSRRQADLNRQARLAGSNPMTREQRIAQQRIDIRERTLGDGGASLMTLQTGVLLNYRILGGIQGMFTGAASAAVEFDKALRQLQAISATSYTEMFKLKESLVEVAKGSKFTAVEVSKAAVLLAQGGFSSSQIKDSMKAVILLAQATGSELSKAVDVTTSVLTVFNKSSDEAEKVANQLTEALNRSKLDMDKLALGIQYAGNTSEDAGVKFEELVASLGAMANAGIRSGSTLGTGFSQVLTALQKPSEKFKTTLDRVGLTLDDVNIKTQGFRGVLNNLREAGFTANDAIQAFEVRGARAFTALTNNKDTMDKLVLSLEDTSAAFAANEIQMGSFANQADRLKGNLGVLAAEGLTPLLALLRNSASGLADATGEASTFTTAVQILGTTIALALGAVTINLIGRTLSGFAAMVHMGPALAASMLMIRSGFIGAAVASTTLAARASAAGLALRGVGAGMAAVLGGWPGLIAAIVAGIAVYVTWGRETERLNSAFDKQKGRFDQAAEAMDKVKQSAEKIDDAISELTNQYGRLNASSAETQTAAKDMQARFKDLGIGLIDFTNITVDGLINKLKDLRSEIQGDYIIKMRVEGEEQIKLTDALIAKQKATIKEEANQLQGIFSSANPRLNGNKVDFPEGFNQKNDYNRLLGVAASGKSDTGTLKKFGFDSLADVQRLSAQVKTSLSNVQGSEENRKIAGTLSTLISDRMDKIFSLLDSNMMKAANNKGAPTQNRINIQAQEQIKLEMNDQTSNISSAQFIERAYRNMTTKSSNLKRLGTKDGFSAARKQREDFIAKFLPTLDGYKAEATQNLDLIKDSNKEEDLVARQIFQNRLEKINLVRDLLTKEEADLKEEAKKQKKQDLQTSLEAANKKISAALALLAESSKNNSSQLIKVHTKAVLDAIAEAESIDLSMHKLDSVYKNGVLDDKEQASVSSKYAEMRGNLKLQSGAANRKLESDINQKLRESAKEREDARVTASLQDLDTRKEQIERTYANEKGEYQGTVAALKARIKSIQDDQASTYATDMRAKQLKEKAAALSKTQLSLNPDVAESQRNLIKSQQFALTTEANKLKTSSFYQGLTAEFQRRGLSKKLEEAQESLSTTMVLALEKLIAAYQKVIDTEIKPKMDAAQIKRDTLSADIAKMEASLSAKPGALKTFNEEEQLRYDKLKQDRDSASSEYDRLFSKKKDYEGSITSKTDDLAKARTQAEETRRNKSPIQQSIVDGAYAAQNAAAASFSDIMTKMETRALRGTKNIREAFKSMGVGMLETMLQTINNAIAKKFMTMLLDLGMSAFGSFGGSGGSTFGVDGSGASIGSTAFTAYHGGSVPVRHFAGGGMVGGGANLGRDSVPALLAPNEFVINSSSASILGEDFLQKLNKVDGSLLSKNAPKSISPMMMGSAPKTTNVYVVSKDQVPAMGADDVVATVADDIRRNGPIKQLIKSIRN